MANEKNGRHPGRGLKYSVILVIFLILAYASYFSCQSWRDSNSEELSRLAAIADLSEKAVDSYFSQLEIGMRNLGMELAGPGNKLDIGHAYELVSRFQTLHTELSNVMLIRADGQILVTGISRNSRELPTLANDFVFAKFRDELLRGPIFMIGQPVIGHIDNSWSVSARYAITDPTGKLLYILSANLPTDLLQRYWVETASPKISAIGLVRDDGYIVNRHPEPDGASMDNIYGKPIAGAMNEYLLANNFPQRGLVESTGGDGADKKVQMMRRLSHYPLTLFAEVPMAEIQAAWWRKAQVPYLLMALMLAGMVIGFNRMLRRRKVWSMEQRREANRRSYEKALFDRSPNEIYIFDDHTLQFTYVNDYALNNLGYTLEEMHNKTIFNLHPEMPIETFANMVTPLRRGEQEAIKYKTVQKRADGSTYPVEVNLQLITSGDNQSEGNSGFLAIVNDITALKEAEENIKEFNSPRERRATGRKQS